MRYQLQPQVPYNDSLRWEMNQKYYRSVGLQAWLKQEVPFNITSNHCAAKQAAQLVFSSAKGQDKVQILETGAGLGLFAIHFLEILSTLFENANQKKPILEYWLTDFSLQTLKEAQAKNVFSKWIDQGILKFYQLDIYQSDSLLDVDGNQIELTKDSWDLVIGNYQHSPLKQQVLCQQMGQWYQKHTELFYWLTGTPELPPTQESIKEAFKLLSDRLKELSFQEHVAPDHPQIKDFQALDNAIKNTVETMNGVSDWDIQTDLKTWLYQHLESNLASHLHPLITPLVLNPLFDFKTHSLEQTEEISSYKEIILEDVIKNKKHIHAFKKIESTQVQSTLLYPEATLNAFTAWMPYLKEHGLILTVDKGHYHVDCLRGFYEVEATIHGNSLAHAVNFPLIQLYFEQEGYPTIATQDPSYALQTLLIGKKTIAPEVEKVFKNLWVETNQNEDSHAFLEAGHLFLNQGQLNKAIQFFLKALKLRPNDATLLYFLSVAYLNLEQYSKALECLNCPHDDTFGIFNFDILKAETYRLLEQYPQAIEAYIKTLKHFGESSLVCYNLGLCYEAQGDKIKAQDIFKKASELDPNDSEILAALKS